MNTSIIAEVTTLKIGGRISKERVSKTAKSCQLEEGIIARTGRRTFKYHK